MELVVRDLCQELGAGCLTVIRKVKQMNHARLLLQDGLPAEINNALETERLVVLFPSMANQDRVRLGQRLKLKL